MVKRNMGVAALLAAAALLLATPAAAFTAIGTPLATGRSAGLAALALDGAASPAKHHKTVANTTDLQAVYSSVIGVRLTPAQFHALVAEEAAAKASSDAAAAPAAAAEPEKHHDKVGTVGAQASFLLNAESFQGITPSFQASALADFANVFDQEGSIKGMRNPAAPGTATVKYFGKLAQVATQLTADNLPGFPEGLKVVFENSEIDPTRKGGSRKLLAMTPNPACAFELSINNGTELCTALFPGNTTETISFGGVSSTLQALVERSQRLELSCTLSGQAPVEIPSGCLSTV